MIRELENTTAAELTMGAQLRLPVTDGGRESSPGNREAEWDPRSAVQTNVPVAVCSEPASPPGYLCSIMEILTSSSLTNDTSRRKQIERTCRDAWMLLLHNR